MKNPIITTIQLDFDPETMPPTVYAKQFDRESRFVDIVPLLRGEKYELEEDITARLQLTKPDGHTVINDATIEDGVIRAEFTEQALIAHGTAVAEIGLYKDKALLSSQVFYIEIKKAAYNPDAPESSDEYNALVTALESIKKSTEAANAAAKKADDSASAASSAAESAISATEDAVRAAQNAGSAALAAQTAAESADAAAKRVTDAVNEAKTAKEEADKAADAANVAASNATKAAEAANTAAGSADTAKVSANDAAASANTAAGAANLAATAATTAAEDATSAAAEARGAKAEILAIVENLAEKSDLEKTNNKLNALWKLNKGISYDFVTDSEEGYAKNIPDACKYAATEIIGGKTVVWNKQTNNSTYGADADILESLPVGANLNNTHYYLFSGVFNATAGTGAQRILYLYANDSEGQPLAVANVSSVTNINIFTAPQDAVANGSTGANSNSLWIYSAKDSNQSYTVSDVLLIDLTQIFGVGNEPTTTDDARILWVKQYAKAHPEYNAGELVSADVKSLAEQSRNLLDVKLLNQATGSNTVKNENGWIDLSGQFAGGNIWLNTKVTLLPGVYRGYLIGGDFTAADAIVWFNGDGVLVNASTSSRTAKITVSKTTNISVYFHINKSFEYNGKIAVTLVSGTEAMEEYSPYHRNTYTIPTAVRNLTGYGWSAGNVYNSIERTESGWQYVQRAGLPETETGYTALDTPVITDITDLMADFPNNFTVEGGGAIAFENDAGLSVPATVKYLRSLAEVGS